VVVARAATVADELRAATEKLTDRRQSAQRAQAMATEQQDVATRELALAEHRAAEQQSVLSEIESRIDHALAEADALAQIDQALSAEIAASQAELARQADLARRRAAAAAPHGTSPGGGPVRSLSPAPGAPAGLPRPQGPLALARVEGIVVAASIAEDLARLLAHARSDGFELSGSGFRDAAAQVEVRRRNCGPSDYEIWEMPASQCSPPSARPGRSMHEQGLAVDFTWQGAIINSRSSPAFQWLAANAATYGLYNLPSEPWHWSTNGR
jgi:hypothetical protein